MKCWRVPCAPGEVFWRYLHNTVCFSKLANVQKQENSCAFEPPATIENPLQKTGESRCFSKPPLVCFVGGVYFKGNNDIFVTLLPRRYIDAVSSILVPATRRAGAHTPPGGPSQNRVFQVFLETPPTGGVSKNTWILLFSATDSRS